MIPDPSGSAAGVRRHRACGSVDAPRAELFDGAVPLPQSRTAEYGERLVLRVLGRIGVQRFFLATLARPKGAAVIVADVRRRGFRAVEAGPSGLEICCSATGSLIPAHPISGVLTGSETMDRTRVLNDLGIALLSLGDVVGAEQALAEVVRRERTGTLRTNALIELMHCASFRRDRVSFERMREDCLTTLDAMPPIVRADYYFKVGVGLARFGNFVKAESNARHALEIASAHALHEVVFRIERIVDGLRSCEAPEEQRSPTEPIVQTDALREVRTSLAALSS
jgi:hypothetical protein